MADLRADHHARRLPSSNLFNTDWSKFDLSFLLSLIALGICVGFSEEMMSRGLVLTAFRSRL